MERRRTTLHPSLQKQETSPPTPPKPLPQKSPIISLAVEESQSEDIFEPQYHTMKKQRMPIYRRLHKGVWTLEQNKTYLKFLIRNKDSFTTQSSRREDRVFCRLSEMLHKKRTPDQCRSHHQKLLAGEGESIDALILRIRMKIAQSQEQKLLNRKTRIFNKFRSRRLEKTSSHLEVVPQAIPQAKQQPQVQILHVDRQQFFNLTTFKNSSRILLQIEEEAIQSYSLQ